MTIEWNYIQKERGPVKRILLNGVLILKLPNNPFASCFLINFDFLLPHISQFDNIIILPLLVSQIFWVYIFLIFSTL